MYYAANFVIIMALREIKPYNFCEIITIKEVKFGYLKILR